MTQPIRFFAEEESAFGEHIRIERGRGYDLGIEQRAVLMSVGAVAGKVCGQSHARHLGHTHLLARDLYEVRKRQLVDELAPRFVIFPRHVFKLYELDRDVGSVCKL